MDLVFVHGWSVTDTNTYGQLPKVLQQRAANNGLDIDITDIHLGRYISFHDEVSMADLARAFDQALRDQLPDNADGQRTFSCITHSTGGPVVREWIERYYGADRLGEAPLQHLVMLAPANHGSALAQIGKSRVGRIKAWFGGVEPGQRILDWLALGSDGQRELCDSYLEYAPAENGFFPFVLTGQTIDDSLYDFLNNYLTEVGSDGVVRACAANLNYGIVKLVEQDGQFSDVRHHKRKLRVQLLSNDGGIKRPQPVPFGVVSGASHSGGRIGIMRSPNQKNADDKPVVTQIVECLQVSDPTSYALRLEKLQGVTQLTQKDDEDSRKHRFKMFVFSIYDDEGDPIDDFDMFILAGADYRPDKLPSGFFVDRQKNNTSTNRIVYYVDYDVMSSIKDGKIGFRVIARPQKGFSYYKAVEFRSDGIDLDQLLRPNETLYVDIEIRRRVDKEVFRLDPASGKQGSFKPTKPSGALVD